MTWTEALHGDPIPWLLERENPPVRYWTLRVLLDKWLTLDALKAVKLLYGP